jgi:hypothetical protein
MADPFATLFEDAAPLLLVGGLAVLTVILLLVALQSLFPERAEGSPSPASRELHALGAQEATAAGPDAAGAGEARPRRRGPPPAVLPIDRALANAAAQGLGEPRLLRWLGGVALVRLYGCACPARPAAPHACAAQRDGLAAAFATVHGRRVTAREVSCTASGAAACEFEVRT